MDAGKGGKSLALMQQRLLGKQEQEAAKNQSQTQAPQPDATVNNPASAAVTMTPNPMQPQIMQQVQPMPTQQMQPISSAGASAGRSKGKDFAQMSKRSAAAPPDQTAFQQHQHGMPQHGMPQQQPQMHSSLNTNHMGSSIPQPVQNAGQEMQKSKGKDFAAMAQRSAPSAASSHPATVPNPTAAMTLEDLTRQSLRSASDLNRKNAARKAAGMPPIQIDPNSGIPNNIPTQQVPSMRTTAPVPSQVPGSVSTQGGIQTPIAVNPLQHLDQRRTPAQMQQQNRSNTNVNMASTDLAHNQWLENQRRAALANEAGPGTVAGSVTGSAVNMPITSSQPSRSMQPMKSNPNIKGEQQQQQTQPPKVAPQSKPTPKPTKAEGVISALSMTAQPPLVGIKLSTLVKSLDPSGLFTLEPDAEEQLLALANDFANSLIKKSMRVAQHRNSFGSGARNAGTKRKRVEVQDVAIVLKKNYGITIPGLSGISNGKDLKRGSSGSSTIATSGKVNLSTARALGSVSLQPSSGAGGGMVDLGGGAANGANAASLESKGVMS